MVKEFFVTIDNENSEHILIQDYNKSPTNIVLNQSPDTAFNNDILVDAYIYTSEFENDIEPSIDEYDESEYNIPFLEHVNTDLNGVVSITIYNGNTIYYQKNIQFSKGHITDSIKNTLPIGDYNMVIEYNGNKFLQSSSLSTSIKVEKRLAQLISEESYYYGNPGDVITITGILQDYQSHNPISNCLINYSFNQVNEEIITNSNGTFTVDIRIPDIDTSHCRLKNNTIEETIEPENDFQEENEIEYESDDVIDEDTEIIYYPNMSYKFIASIDNDSYYLSDTEITITANKVPTSTTITSLNTNTISNTLQLVGSSIAHFKNADEDVKYGEIQIEIPNFNYTKNNIMIENGIFNTDINLTDFYHVYNENTNETITYDATKKINTSINVFGDIYNDNGERVVIYKNNVYIENDDRLSIEGDDVQIQNDETINIDNDDFYIEAGHNILIESGDTFTIQAQVTSTYDDEYVKDGMLLFSLYDDKKMNNLIHRYAANIDASGTGVFNFNTSMAKTYTLQVKYVGIFNYNDSYSSKYTVRVI